MEEKNKGRLSNIELILPVIELRIDKFANTAKDEPLRRVNFHVIFSNELTPDQIQEQFLNSLTAEYKLEYEDSSYWSGVITKESLIDLGNKLIQSSNGKLSGSPLKIGFNSINIPYEKLLEKLDKSSVLKNKYLTAVGKTEWDTMRWDGSPAEKKNIINKANFIFSASPSVELALKGKESLKEQNVNNNLLHCSDAHTFINDLKNTKKKELGHCFTWIKADPTFEGLKQIIYEPEERVRIQENKPEEKPSYQVIDRIEISHSDFADKEGDVINKKTIYLNPNLNTIIGGRSTGKSILLGTIAKKLSSTKEVKFNNPEYSQYIDEIVQKTKIFWTDSEENNTRDIEYFPQSYMYQLAKNTADLDKLVENIITQDSKRKTEIDSYNSFSANNNSNIINDINVLFKTKSSIDDIQKQITEIGDEKGITKEKQKLADELENLKSKINITDEDWSNYYDLKKELDANFSLIQELEKQKSIVYGLKSISFINNINNDIINLNDDIKKRIEGVFEELKQKYLADWSNQIEVILVEIESKISTIKKRNEEIEKNSLYVHGKSVVDSNLQYKEVDKKHKKEVDNLRKIEELKKQKSEHEKLCNSLKYSILEKSKEYHIELKKHKATCLFLPEN